MSPVVCEKQKGPLSNVKEAFAEKAGAIKDVKEQGKQLYQTYVAVPLATALKVLDVVTDLIFTINIYNNNKKLFIASVTSLAFTALANSGFGAFIGWRSYKKKLCGFVWVPLLGFL
eukprot:gene17689-784_t